MRSARLIWLVFVIILILLYLYLYFALGRASATVLGRVLNGRDAVLSAVSSSHAAGRGLLTWLLCCMCIGWRVQDV